MALLISIILLKQEVGKNLYNIVGGKYCTRCKLVKNHLDSLNIKYNYIDCESEYGKQLVDEYKIDELPYIYDNVKVYTLKEVLTS